MSRRSTRTMVRAVQIVCQSNLCVISGSGYAKLPQVGCALRACRLNSRLGGLFPSETLAERFCACGYDSSRVRLFSALRKKNATLVRKFGRPMGDRSHKLAFGLMMIEGNCRSASLRSRNM
jgi:hypothetical protein